MTKILKGFLAINAYLDALQSFGLKPDCQDYVWSETKL